MKWLLDDEQDIDRAVALRDAAISGALRMVAPSLWAYEIVDAVVSATRTKRITDAVGTAGLAALLEIGVRMVDPEPARVFDLSLELGLAGCDASYVALAEALRCQCWTADGPLTRAGHELVRDIATFPA